MRCLLILLSIYGVVTVAQSLSNPGKFRPDYTYNDDPIFEGWLKYHEVPATWHDARLQCEYEGALLASPVDHSLLDFLQPRIGDCKDKMVFTGIHTYSAGNFATIEGRLLSEFEHKWAPGEPDNYENKESCIAMLQDGTLANVNCNQTLPYLCYKRDFRNLYYNTKCDTIDKAYIYKSETGSCYKFHKTLMNWSEAHKVCMAERARLAIINSKEESNVLKQIYLDAATDLNATYANLDTNFKHDFAYVHIGFREINAIVSRGLWRTIDGQTLEAAGFSTFSDGEPNRQHETCGSIRGDNGKLNDIGCTKLSPFICEKKAEKDPDDFDYAVRIMSNWPSEN